VRMIEARRACWCQFCPCAFRKGLGVHRLLCVCVCVCVAGPKSVCACTCSLICTAGVCLCVCVCVCVFLCMWVASGSDGYARAGGGSRRRRARTHLLKTSMWTCRTHRLTHTHTRTMHTQTAYTLRILVMHAPISALSLPLLAPHASPPCGPKPLSSTIYLGCAYASVHV
jgi:hypothetical protein